MKSHVDVRKKGFAKRSSVQEVLHWIDGNANRLPSEKVELITAAERVLTTDVVSSSNVPEFRRAMMDGYAVVADTVDHASLGNRIKLNVVDTAFPGKPAERAVDRGNVIEVMTGAPMPAGADAVLPFEETIDENGDTFVCSSVAVGRNIGSIGEDIAVGDIILRAGRRLRPQDIGVLSSIGQDSVDVVRRPIVRVLITGNEIAQPEILPDEFQIRDANGPMLEALIGRTGAVCQRVYCADDPEMIRREMLAPADVVLVSGGSSAGTEDFAPILVNELGELNFHGIDLKPGRPTGVGRVGEKFVVLLPGNPVACLCAYDFFARRIIQILAGENPEWTYRVQTKTLAKKISSANGRLDYCRVRVLETQAEPVAASGASVLSSTTRADGFVVVAPETKEILEGEIVTVHLYD